MARPDGTESARPGPVLGDLVRRGPQGRVAVLLRHAEREGPNVERFVPVDEEDWRLTPEGEAAARQFGSGLPEFRTVRLRHTPKGRTQRTAERIAEGFSARWSGSRADVAGVDPELALSVISSRDDDGRRRWMERLGPDFFNGWVRGEVPADVLVPAPEAVGRLLRHLHAQLVGAAESSLQLAVAHDVSLFVVTEVVFGRRTPPRPWAGFLEGIVFEPAADDRLRLVWRGEERTVLPRVLP